MSTIFPISIPSKRLAASITSASSTFQLDSILSWDGATNLTSADFGTVAYGAFRNDTNTAIEFFEFDPSTIASASITILRRGLKYNGDLTTEVSGNKLTWVKNQTIVEIGADVPQLLKHMITDIGDQTVTGIKTFPSADATRARVDTDTDTTVAEAFVTLGQLSRQAVSGASNASTTVKGIVELATQAETDARTTTGATGAKLVPTPDTQRSTLLSDYKVDTGAANAYVITPIPAITVYTVGQIFSFKAVNANTTTSTINVSGLGVKTIKKLDGATNLATGDISAGQMVQVEYDGTNMVMISPTAKSIQYNGSVYPAANGAAITDIVLQASYPRGETVNGATTPVPVVLIDDTFQEETIAAVNCDFGKVTTGNKAAFGFKVQGAITLTTLKVWLKKASAPTDNVVFTIQTDSAGAPSGTPVTNGTANSISGAGLTTSYVLTTVTFGSTVTLAANTQYWLVGFRDSTTSDTNYYRLNGIAAANTYASFTGSTNNASSWSTGADIPYVQLICATGNSTSVWRCDTDHANFHMRFGVGVVNTDGAISVSNNVIFRGVLGGFTSLVPMQNYYAQDTIGTLGVTPGTTETLIGTSLSPTQIAIGFGSDKQQYIGTMALSSGANDLHWGFQKARYIIVTGSSTTGAPSTDTFIQPLYVNGFASASETQNDYVPGGSNAFSSSISGRVLTTGGTGSVSGNAYFFK